jgi:CRP-like cAMP-binding protein
MKTTIDIFKFEKNVEYFSAGETVFNAGDEGNCMYVVQEGEVDVLANGKVIDSLGPGGMFGEMALIDHSPRSATVMAKTDCKLVPLDEDKFMAHVHRTPFFALTVMRLMTARLRNRMLDKA